MSHGAQAPPKKTTEVTPFKGWRTYSPIGQLGQRHAATAVTLCAAAGRGCGLALDSRLNIRHEKR